MKWMKRLICLTLLPVLLIPARGAELEVSGKSSLLMDAATGQVLLEQNAHQPLAPASVTKIMTMLLIMEAIDSGALGWQDMVTASETAAAKGGSQVYLKAGETMSVSDMVKSIAVSSANDCACAMAEHLAGSEEAFVSRMNQRAKELGMENTHFVNCTGLDDGPDAEKHKTSAYDIGLMSRQLLKYHPDIKKYTTIWMDTLRNGTFGLSNTNKLIRFYKGATGLKTGYTAAAGYCLSATAQRENMELIAVVMGSPSAKERNAACKQLLDYGFANFALLEPKLEELAQVPVVLGTEGAVPVVLGQTGGVLVEKARRQAVTTRVRLDTSVTAPVAEGQTLGFFQVLEGDRILQEIPLQAQHPVPRLTYGQLCLKVLKKMACCR